MVKPLKLQEDYWESFEVQDADIEYLYNHLIDVETPQTPREIITAIINNRTKNLIAAAEKEKIQGGKIFIPSDEYKVGDLIAFPSFDWKGGHVESIRKGFNPEFEDFDVISVALDNGEKKLFASRLNKHKLNDLSQQADVDPLLNADYVFEKFGGKMQTVMEENLEKNQDLVRIAGCWFPKSLLVDIHIGHLNLVEAVLEEAGGGPLSTKQILDHIELQSNTNLQLTEFSLNYALQEDPRFDEVGPAGEVVWYLKEKEPAEIQKPPIFLQYEPISYDHASINNLLEQFEGDVFDELEQWEKYDENNKEISISLIFPHWRSGTLPLSPSLVKFFPTAYEAPRVRFTFFDEDSKKRFPGWVVRTHRYVYGLQEWYTSHGLMPGSLVFLKQGEHAGEIIMRSQKYRQSREWMRTALIGSDQGIVFGMLKQNVTATFNDRLAIVVPDAEAFDEIWKKNSTKKEELGTLVIRIMRELSKLNPQVHAQELYAAVNMVRRCPPGAILNCLTNSKEVQHLGHLYFRISEGEG